MKQSKKKKAYHNRHGLLDSKSTKTTKSKLLRANGDEAGTIRAGDIWPDSLIEKAGFSEIEQLANKHIPLQIRMDLKACTLVGLACDLLNQVPKDASSHKHRKRINDALREWRTELIKELQGFISA